MFCRTGTYRDQAGVIYQWPVAMIFAKFLWRFPPPTVMIIPHRGQRRGSWRGISLAHSGLVDEKI